MIEIVPFILLFFWPVLIGAIGLAIAFLLDGDNDDIYP